MIKLTFDRIELLEKLKKANAFVPKKAILSAYETFLFVIKDGHAAITATDGQKQITITCDYIKSEEDGMFTVPTKLIIHVLSLLLEKDISINVKNSKVEIKCGKSKYNMPSESGAEYPLIQNIEPLFEASFTGVSFNKATEVAKNFADPEDNSPALQGVLFRTGDNNNINICGCSRQQAAKVVVSPRSINQWFDVVVPTQAIIAINKSISDDAIIDVIHDKDRIEIISDGIRIKALCFNVKYPDVEIFFKKKSENKIELNTVQVVHALQRLDVFSNTEVPLISLDIKTMSLTIDAADDLFNKDAQEVIDIVAEKEMKMGVNIKFLTNVMKSFTNDTFNLLYEDHSKPLRIEPINMIKDNDVFFIVMPIMI